MMRKGLFLCCLSACLVLLACPSGPSSSGPDRTSDQGQASALEDKLDFLQDLLEQRHAAIRAWDGLMTALPDRVLLTEVVYDPEGVQVKGNAPSNNLLADYISRLEQSPGLTGVMLRSSVQKRDGRGDYQEFALQASAGDAGGEAPVSSGPPAARLAELEKLLPPGPESGDALRQLQMLASDAGLQMTGFAPGTRTAGKHYDEWPVSISVTGSREDLGRYLRGMADLDRLWVLNKFSFKAVSSRDARSAVRASIATRTFFLRKMP